jgi:hypothetical protein
MKYVNSSIVHLVASPNFKAVIEKQAKLLSRELELNYIGGVIRAYGRTDG